MRVIVENTTYSKASGAPWDGTLVDTWVNINEETTMMSCVGYALDKNNISVEGIDSGYISEINGLSDQGGEQSGWMGTLNDWFTNEGFDAYTVAAGTLSAGDEIRIMYTCAWGADLGSDSGSTDKTLKALSFSPGTLSPAFHKDTHSYTLTVPAGTDKVVVTPTASNKNYQVRTYVGETEYKRTAAVPVADDTVITVKCGDSSWPSMNNGEYGNGSESIPGETYTVTVKAESGTVPQGSLASLIFYKSTSTTAAPYPMTPDFAAGTKEYTLSVPDQDGDSLYVAATPNDSEKTVKAEWTNLPKEEKRTATVSATSRTTLANCIKKGTTGNTVTLTIGDNEDAYTVKVVRTPTLKSLSLADSGGSSVVLAPVFSPSVTAYRAVTTAERVTLTAEGYDAGYTVTYNESVSGEIELYEGDNPVTVKVTNPANGRETVYTVTVTRTKAVTVTFTTTPSDAAVLVRDHFDAAVAPDADGSYSLLSGETYSYAVTCSGYVSEYQGNYVVPTAAQNIQVTLTAVPVSDLTDVGAAWKNFRNSDVNMAITSARTPKTPKTTALKWAEKLGSGWRDAPSVQIIVDNSLIVMSGTSLYKLNLSDRSIEQATMVNSPSFGYTPPTYAEGMIFCPLGDGTVQAFNAKTLESLWVYQDPGKGQALSPITYSDGYIYTGFWNSETKSDNYVCLSVTDEDPYDTSETKYATWTKSVPGGFYWAGSVVVGDVLVVGTDDGAASGTSGTSHLYALNKKNGNEISHLDLTGMGDQRSSIAYSGGRVYFTTKGGYLCSAAIIDGTLSDLKSVKIGAQSSSTPVVYKGHVYVCAGVGFQGVDNFFVIANADTLAIEGKVQLQGYPQCSPLLSTAYEDEGYLYFYCTYNKTPGGISLIKVKSADQSAELVELYDAAGYEQYCITSIICGTDGTLYYKNDSGNVFAVGVSTDAQKAQQVQDQIAAIGTVTLDSENAIKAARAAYDALTDAQKELVNNLSVLTDAEKKLAQLKKEKADQDAADAVVAKIQAVETAVASGDKAAIRQAIRAARTAYNSLTSAQKKLVTNYSVLTEAEKAYPDTSHSTKPGSNGGSSKPADSTVKSSDTGDSSQMMLWMGGVLLSAAALTVLTRKRKRS